MRAMGIDIGTTTISVIMADGDDGRLLGKRTVSHRAFLEGSTAASRIQDPEQLCRLSIGAAGELIKEHGRPDSIGMTGQMHGALYVDGNGESVSPLYTWQDGSGNELLENGLTYAEVLRERTGMASAGYGLTTHYYLQKNNKIPFSAQKMTTISDYLAMKLCGCTEPSIAKDMAASWGCYNLEKGDFCRLDLEEAGVELKYLPKLLEGHNIVGETIGNQDMGIPDGIPVSASMGDNQASIIGAVRDLSDTVLVNIGTGSQVSFGTERYLETQGAIELRPYTEQTFLMAGSSLCGGRAYAMLEKFYSEVCHGIGGSRDTDLYILMEKQAREFLEKYGKEAGWKIRTTFSGTRSNPDESGSITGISEVNFHPGAMTIGMIRGILEELYGMYQDMCLMTGKKAHNLVGSGNGIRKNSLMQEMAEDLFQMPMAIPFCDEEAAYGAALQSLVSAGFTSSLHEMRNKIRYYL